MYNRLLAYPLYTLLGTVNFNKMKTILNVIVVLMLLVALINQIANDQIMITVLLLWVAHTLRYVAEKCEDRFYCA